ncbi:MAG: ATP-binding protein [Anaerolineae bacterium]|jgi:anti-sigma regulatory factor (Ser/Thr protein kinase)
MRELSLHLLDIAENAIAAGARHLHISISESLATDSLVMTVQDDGCGMDAETLAKVRTPFFTTRTTRDVGLGIPFLAAAAERCGGGLEISSELGVGTTVVARFQRSHIDRAPLGDVAGALMAILLRGDDERLRLTYEHRIEEWVFAFDTRELHDLLGGMSPGDAAVRRWLSEYLARCEQELKEQSCPRSDLSTT